MTGLFTGNCFDGDECIAHGLEELGHNITKINYRTTPFVNIKLLSIYKKYDLMIVGKGDSILPITLKKITIPKILWYGDQRKHVQKWVVNRAKCVDLFLHTTAGCRLNEYYEQTNTPSGFFMVPCQPSLYKKNKIIHP